VKYWRTSKAAPATIGEEKLVPAVSARLRLLSGLTGLTAASSAVREVELPKDDVTPLFSVAARTNPGAAISGLMRPSSDGPGVVELARFSIFPLSPTFPPLVGLSVAATTTLFLAAFATCRVPTPSFPAE